MRTHGDDALPAALRLLLVAVLWLVGIAVVAVLLTWPQAPLPIYTLDIEGEAEWLDGRTR